MLRSVVGAGACLVFAVACGEAASPPAPPATSAVAREQGPSVPGQLVVRFEEGVSAEEQAAFLAARGLTVERSHLDGEFVTVGLPEGSSQEDVAASLGGEEVVASAEAIGLWEPLDAPEPDDPWFHAQRWNFTLVQALKAWEKTHGAGVIVAVIDTGVAYEDYTDPLTRRQFVKGPDFGGTNFVYPKDIFDGDDHPNDDYGHGTHVAGTIAEATNNGLEAAGIASDALIMPVKACGLLPPPDPYACRQDDVADAIDWATTHGADVINLSIGGRVGGSLEEAAIDRALSAGIVVVASSGNRGTGELWYPAAYPGVIAVGATDASGVRAAYSNYGSTPAEPEPSFPRRDLDLMAPGGDERDFTKVRQSTFPDFCEGAVPPDDPIDVAEFATCGVRGTSQAAAHVSAIAALVLSLQPDLRSDEVRELLQCSARDLGPAGFDLEYGYGMVQAGDAMQDSDGDGVFDCLDRPEDTCGVAASATPTAAPTGGAVANGMPTPVNTPTPSPTDAPTPSPTGTPTPTPTESPTPTENPSPTPTDTPSPTPSLTPSASPTAGAVACGDVDCDYDVDSVDALGVLRWVAQLSEPDCIDKGYTNCDGFINSVDALFILKYVAALPVGGGDGCPVIGYE